MTGMVTKMDGPFPGAKYTDPLLLAGWYGRQAEIDELRAEVELWKQRAHDEDTHRKLAAEAAEAFRAENVRLRNEQATLEQTNRWQAHEIERLRAFLQVP